jgi:SAM-dependent methyltransferase
MLSQKLYWRLRPWLTPGLQNSHAAYARLLEAEVTRAQAWLDLGCGHYFVPDWLTVRMGASAPRTIVGVDLDAEALRKHQGLSHKLVANGETLPFRDASFDLVTMNMVLEHVREPQLLIREVTRVLRRGGTFVVHTPNARGYTTRLTRLVPAALRAPLATVLQGRSEEDVYPTFYRANTEPELRALGESAGLQLRTVTLVNSSPLFVNFAPLLIPEMFLIRAINALGLDHMRACLLARFEKSV